MTAKNDYQLIAMILAQGWEKGIKPSEILNEDFELLSGVVALANTIKKREMK